ncbi:MAG TPA: MoaD/ThiS family protein [Chthonomonadaceae bacterium]|nr:MoaD/ThiS family protein [Chthonomonadaceae bacterium]
MAVTIKLNEKLVQWSGGTAEATVTAATVREALLQLARQQPALATRLFNCDGELRTLFRFTRNGEPVTLDTPLHDGDTLLLELA